MLIWPDCIPCTLKMALGVARTAIKDDAKIREFLREVSKIRSLRAEDWQATSPEVARDVWLKLVEVTGNADSLRAVKDEQNRIALELYPRAKRVVAASADPFLAALKLAIAGNALDAMVGVDASPSAGLIDQLEKFRIDLGDVEIFRARMKGAKRIVYFADNCGEIVFDKLFLEVVSGSFELEPITVVTRTLPVLNDATLREAREVGLDEGVAVVANGMAEPFPGTSLAKVSPEVRDLVEAADVVVSKGVGNYESLTEEQGLSGRVTYLYHGKCVPCCSAKGAALGDLVVFNG
jgi:uncharacterized protein with ATP-grasp and redox domains